MWHKFFELKLKDFWQLSSPVNCTVFRLCSSVNNSDNPIVGQVALAKRAEDRAGEFEIFHPRKIVPSGELEIIQFPKPPTFWQPYCLAVKQLVFPSQSKVNWSISVDMSTFSNAPTPPTSSSNVNTTTVAVNVASTTLLAANPQRAGAIVINNSTKAILYINFGSAASLTNYTYKLAINGGGVEVPFDYVGEIFGIWDKADASGSAKVQEFS